MSKLVDRPDWRRCAAIIREEAARHHADEQSVIMGGRDREVMAARRAAVRRILDVTGCTHLGLSRVWGLGVAAIRAAVGETRTYTKRPKPPAKTHETYDDATIARLRWQYGDERASQIIAGKDAASSADQAAWRRVGGVTILQGATA